MLPWIPTTIPHREASKVIILVQTFLTAQEVNFIFLSTRLKSQLRRFLEGFFPIP